MHSNTIISLLVLLTAGLCKAVPQLSANVAGNNDKLQDRVRRSDYVWPGGVQGQTSTSLAFCGDPGTPRHGSTVYTSWYERAIVTHSCNPGHVLEGAKRRICQQNGEWTPSIPKCLLVDCEEPGVPLHGSAYYLDTYLSSLVSYSCNMGFIISGDNQRVCQLNGSWSGSVPTCTGDGCPRLPFLINGHVSVQNKRTGSTAKYSCKAGFVLVGEKSRSCGLDGVWAGDAPTCKKVVDCGTLGNPNQGSVSFQSTTVGSTATYSCFKDYTLVGEDMRTCQSSGVWSGSAPTCKVVVMKCGSLSDVENGRVNVTDNTVGSIATYSCDHGFQLVGKSKRTCLSSGVWSGNEPNCNKIVDCGLLSNPNQGSVLFQSTTIGSTATYSCFKNYTLVGEDMRTCQSNGVWSGNAPTCKVVIVKCEILIDIENGRVDVTDNTVGSVATYSCDHGFQLVGKSKRTCLSSGVWSGSEPNCNKIVDCGLLSIPNQGSVSFQSTTVGSTATYSCFKNYTLVGEDTRTCQSSGVWSGNAPTCKVVVVKCGFLSDIENGRVDVADNTVGSVATYSCDRVFQLVGKSKRTCLSSGVWSGNEPNCNKIAVVQCGNPPSVTNGQVLFSELYVGSMARYTCRAGFSLVGVGARVCLSTGVWSDIAPICQDLSCRDLSPLNNGRIKLTGTSPGSMATYICNSAFTLVGPPIRVCLFNGRWSSRAPICLVLDCPFLTAPAGGRLVLNNYNRVNSVATYQCGPGFDLVGRITRVCGSNGLWSGTEPSCRKQVCPVLLPPKNGKVSVTGAGGAASTALYSCLFGYRLEGNSQRVCQGGKWEELKSICQGMTCGDLQQPDNSGVTFGSNATYTFIDCGKLQRPDNGDVEFTSTVVGSSATYSCREGFTLVGVVSRTCMESGEWPGEEPTCKGVTCGTLSEPANGKISFSGGEDFGSVATYSCEEGFELVGEKTRTCGADGKWSKGVPQCKERDCGNLLHPLNGDVTLTGTIFGSVATYSCDRGFSLVGLVSRVCGILGEWLGVEPRCTATLCPALPNPEHGHVDQNGNGFGDTAVYSCDRGYIKTGQMVRTCLQDGQWSSVPPTCEPRLCSSLPFLLRGRITLSDGNKLHSEATYICDEGYTLESGDAIRTCDFRGHWSGVEPFCELVMCESVPHPTNGIVHLTGFSYGSLATYSCFENHVLVGSKVRRCLASGLWSDRSSTCKFMAFDCGHLEDPLNGRVTFDDTIVESVAAYRCNVGYTLQGGNERQRCLPGIGWDGVPPVCQPVDCGTLVDPPYGKVFTTQGSTFGSVATYRCDPGHLMEGSNSRSCQDSARWTGHIPVCLPVDCETLIHPINGFIFISGTTFGDVVTYQCNTGYELVGMDEQTCQANGVWSGRAPTCESSCGDPGVPSNGSRDGDDFRTGASVSYKCDESFVLIGAVSRTCLSSGQWSASLPNCKPGDSVECLREGEEVLDGCDRRCTCREGKFTECCRVRRNFVAMTTEEKSLYISSVSQLATDSVYKERYNALVASYNSSSNTLAQSTNPGVSQFFPWNRYFLIRYEDLLREIDCRITIPYWDWTALPLNPYSSLVFDDETGFGGSSRENDSCVSSGPFNYTAFQVTPSGGSGCLKREYRAKMFPTKAIIDQDVLKIPAVEFEEFHRFLQLFIISNVRCFVGGQMCTPEAANDPLYLLHLAQSDYIFTQWQNSDALKLNARFSSDSRPLVHTSTPVAVSDYSNNQDLPDGVKVCYMAQSFEENVPPSLASLSDALLKITNDHKLKMDCAEGGIKMMEKEDGSMGHSEKDFMKKMCKE